MKTWQHVLIGVLSGAILVGLILILFNQPKGTPIQLEPPPTDSPFKVYISGGVVNPGLYSVNPGSRVEDLIKQSGGILEGADLNAINPAAFLKDGEKIIVPIKNTSPIAEKAKLNQTIFPLNINLATKDELIQLPNIGETKAASIILYRENNGAFKTIEDIQNVEGIGPSIFDKIKELIIVN